MINFNNEIENSSRFPLKPSMQPQRCIMIEAKCDPTYTFKSGEKEGQTAPIISFTFGSEDGERQSTFTYFDPTNDKDPQKSFDNIKARFVAIYETFAGKNIDKDTFKDCDSIASVFTKMADVLNTGNKGKPLYKHDDKPIIVWLIPVYYNNNVSLPLYKFIERVRPGKLPLIEVDPNYHQIERVKRDKPKGNNPISGVGTGIPPIGDTSWMNDLPM